MIDLIVVCDISGGDKPTGNNDVEKLSIAPVSEKYARSCLDAAVKKIISQTGFNKSIFDLILS